MTIITTIQVVISLRTQNNILLTLQSTSKVSYVILFYVEHNHMMFQVKYFDHSYKGNWFPYFLQVIHSFRRDAFLNLFDVQGEYSDFNAPLIQSPWQLG